MKASDIQIEYIEWQAMSRAGFKELVEFETDGCVRLVLPDGTELFIQTSEWARVQIKEA